MDTAEWSPQKGDVVRVKQGLTVLKRSQFGVPGCSLRKARCMKWLGMSVAHPALFSFYAKCARSKSLGCGTLLS